MASGERITLFGDIVGMNPQIIRDFLDKTGSVYGGSYPRNEKYLSDQELITQNRELLSAAGISDSLPIILCRSEQDRARQILSDCERRMQNPSSRLFWIIDTDPSTFIEAVKSVADNTNPSQQKILRSIMLVNLGSREAFDYIDPTTGIRLVSFSTSPRFPVHPTPAS